MFDGDGEVKLITHGTAGPANRERSLSCLEPLAEAEIRQFDVEVLI